MRKYNGLLRTIGLFLILIIGILFFKRIIYGPNVKKQERKNVTSFVQKYLNNKYGDHNFEIVKIEYDYNMKYVFDFSDIFGYDVDLKSDTVSKFSIRVKGTTSNTYEIYLDNFLEEYYFSYSSEYLKNKELESITPYDKLEEELLEDLKNNVDSSIDTIKCKSALLDIPNNLGRIPSLDEIKNTPSYFQVKDFYFTRSSVIENEQEYENKIEEYLNSNYGKKWDVYIGSNENISCIKGSE